MQRSFLKYLVDPITKENLEVEAAIEKNGKIIEGFLISKTNKYPIVRGIPRFAGYKDDSNYTKSFGYQWNKWSQIQFDSKNVGKPYENFSLDMLDRIAGTKDSDFNGKTIVDIGCGPGRFLETIRQKNGIAIGVDLSDAVEAAGDIFKDDPKVLVCQADVLNSPIKDNAIDGIFSIGVLHHTTNAETGFKEMVRALKPNGWIAVSVYSTGGYYDNFIVNIWRKIFKALWPICKQYPALIYTYSVVYVTTLIRKIPVIRTILHPFLYFFPSIILKEITWSILNTFDSITPSNQYGFTIYQVFKWFKKANLKDIEPSDWAGASLNAKK
jgi:SAM-dependent methyltransferase